MTFKTLLLTTTAAVMLGAPTFAQDATVSTDADAATDTTAGMECAVELVDGICPVAEGDAEVATDMDAEGAMETDTEMATETETDTDMNADTDAAADTMTADATPADATEGDITEFEGMTVSEIIGMDVHGQLDNDVGEIDYIYQAADGYKAVIGIGGFLGLGEYTVALPLEAFSIVEDNKLIVDGFTEDELKALPEIDESDLEALPADYVIS